MENLINLIIFSLVISNFAKCDGSNVDNYQKKAAEKKDFTAKNDAERLEELEFDAEIQRIIQRIKSQDNDKLNQEDGLGVFAINSSDAEQERATPKDKTVGCKNSDESFCFKKYMTNDCTYEYIRDLCPRTCMKCCADIDAGFCKKRRLYCRKKRFQDRMRVYCPQTCLYCKTGLAPPPCVSTTYGCCWDKSTPASAPIGSGIEKCPRCKDKKSPIMCSRLNFFCYDFNPHHRAGRQIRSLCPKTCRVCGLNAFCMDDPLQKENCPRYKRAGDCKLNENGMRYWCPKTCGFCK